MSAILTLPFDNPANWIYDSGLIDISGGVAQLLLNDNPGQDFTEDFADDTGFTYNSDYTEFSGGQVQQKDQKPANSMSYATYTNDINLNVGGGVLTGVPVGGAAVVGNRLDLAYDDLRYVTYAASGNANAQQILSFKFKVKVPYSGTPSSDRWFFSNSKAHNDIKNCIQLRHSVSGSYLRLHIYDSTGALIVEHLCGQFLPIAGSTYEICICINLTDGETRLFLDGNQNGTTSTGTGTRDSNIGILRIGSNYNATANSNFSIEDFVVYDTVLHTSNYTPGYTLSETQYKGDVITLPEMEDTYPGTLVSFDNFITTEANSPRYTLQIGRSGNYLYWNGSAWVTSNNTYSQANDKATFLANVASLPINGEIYGQFRIYTNDGNNQMSVSELTASLTAQIYSVDNPTIEYVSTIRMESLISFLEISIKNGNDEIKYILKKGSDWYYHDGSNFVVSNETYSQSNTAAEILDVIDDFTDSAITFTFKIFLHSDDGLTTPAIQQVEITFDFSGDEEDDIKTCDVYWYARNPDGSVCTEKFYAIPSIFNIKYKDNIFICLSKVIATPDSDTGYVELNLVENVNMVDIDGNPVTYNVFQELKQIGSISVPVSDGALLWDILV